MIPAASRGFSLIEAMISVLVLSIGLLGLAQLQARLTAASVRQQTAAQALVLGASGIERLLAPGADVEPAEPEPVLVQTPAARFQVRYRRVANAGLLSLDARVFWITPSGEEDFRLETLATFNPHRTDTRLLLPTE